MSEEQPPWLLSQEQGKKPSPDTTLVILLGAAQCDCQEFNSNPQPFFNSARKVEEYFKHRSLFCLPQDNFLNLFNEDMSSDDLSQQIKGFILKRRSHARDVIVYFIGHAFFSNKKVSDLNLVIRRTRDDELDVSSFAVKYLADVLKSSAQFLRCILIFDCCFSAAILPHFMGPAASVAATMIKAAFTDPRIGTGRNVPTKGISLLCSSAADDPSLIAPDEKYTMFTRGLLTVLSQANDLKDTHLSLNTVGQLTYDFLKQTYPQAPRPEVHSPDQREGRIEDLPFFPNPSPRKKQANGAVGMEKSSLYSTQQDKGTHFTNLSRRVTIEPQVKKGKQVPQVGTEWSYFLGWIDAKMPGYATFNPGASDEDIAEFEKRTGFALPLPLFNVYSLSNGKTGDFFGSYFAPLDRVIQEWTYWAEFRRNNKPKDLHRLRSSIPSVPSKAIKHDYSNPMWIPVFFDINQHHHYNYIGVDLDPGPAGKIGQVIIFGQDVQQKVVLAESFDGFVKIIWVMLRVGDYFEFRHGFCNLRGHSDLIYGMSILFGGRGLWDTWGPKWSLDYLMGNWMQSYVSADALEKREGFRTWEINPSLWQAVDYDLLPWAGPKQTAEEDNMTEREE